MKKLLFLILISSNVIAESYLCMGEAAGGVYFDEKTFEASGIRFKPTSKLIIKKEGLGWVGPEKLGDVILRDTPNIEVGKCSKV